MIGRTQSEVIIRMSESGQWSSHQGFGNSALLHIWETSAFTRAFYLLEPQVSFQGSVTPAYQRLFTDLTIGVDLNNLLIQGYDQSFLPEKNKLLLLQHVVRDAFNLTLTDVCHPQHIKEMLTQSQLPLFQRHDCGTCCTNSPGYLFIKKLLPEPFSALTLFQGLAGRRESLVFFLSTAGDFCQVALTLPFRFLPGFQAKEF